MKIEGPGVRALRLCAAGVMYPLHEEWRSGVKDVTGNGHNIVPRPNPKSGAVAKILQE
jgi:hypothetical protein